MELVDININVFKDEIGANWWFSLVNRNLVIFSFLS
jgi:hypothetical protein